MPFQPDRSELQRIVDSAFTDPAIIEGLRIANLTTESARAQIDHDRPNLIDSASTEIADFDALDAERNATAKRLLDILGSQPTSWPSFRILSSFALLSALSVPLLYYLIDPMRAYLNPFSETRPAVLFLEQVLASGFLVLTLLLGVRGYLTRRRTARWFANRAAIPTQIETSDIGKKSKTAHERVYDTILRKGIKPRLLEMIGAETTPSYATQIKISSADGLSEVYSSRFEVPTDSKQHLESLLNELPGGSIGIAGPRGSDDGFFL
jgi:hypothetical protein